MYYGLILIRQTLERTDDITFSCPLRLGNSIKPGAIYIVSTDGNLLW